MKKIIDKLFCLHKWNTHEKIQKTITKAEYDPKIGMHVSNPALTMEMTREVLFCDCCGKIKTIEY